MMRCDISLYPDGNLYPKGRHSFVDRPPPSAPLCHRNAYSALQTLGPSPNTPPPPNEMQKITKALLTHR